MNMATRTVVITTLLLSVIEVASGQESQTRTTTSATATTTASGAEERSPAQARSRVREEFSSMLRRYPPDLGTLLATEPSLLANEPFLSRHPEVSAYVSSHPEIRDNPHYYLADFRQSREPRSRSAVSEIFEAFAIVGSFTMVVLGLAWLIRTIIEQRRWSRLTRSQSEVHNKILDRFGTSAELLEYIKSPAGSKFLESAPIQLHQPKPVRNAPVARIMLSVQIGVVIAVGAAGMILASLRLDPEASEALFTMGAIAFCVGSGFIVSALVTIYFSRRLGMWEESNGRTTGDSELVR
jgi:hypothetical protein